MAKDKTKNKPEQGPEPKRRSFLGLLLGLGAGSLAFFAPVYAGIRSVIYPLKQQGISGKFYTLTTLDNLTEEPQKFPIVEDVKDAWVTVPRKTIGTVFLRKVNNNGIDEVQAFQTLCPHAGCTIGIGMKENPQTQQMEMLFSCPCHVANFDMNGARLDKKPDSPRDMDSLETKIEDGKVSVKFEVFAFGTAEKKSS